MRSHLVVVVAAILGLARAQLAAAQPQPQPQPQPPAAPAEPAAPEPAPTQPPQPSPQPAPPQPSQSQPQPQPPAPARLRALPAISVTTYRAIGDAAVTASITLAELSRVTGLTNLRVEQLDRATADRTQIAAELVATAPDSLPAGGRARVALAGEGFPIGTTTGQLTITADQLAEPVVVPFEVHSKRHTWLIIPWFLAFGLLGWLVRHALKNAEARAELRARLEPLRAQVKLQRDTNPDAAQIATLTALDRAVEDALGSRDHAVLEEKVEALRKGLEDALAARAATVSAALQQVLAWKQALAPAWKLPAGAAPGAALAPLAHAEKALLADRPRDAADELGRARAVVDTGGEAVTAWRDRARRIAKELAADAALAHTPAPVRAEVAAAAAAAQQKLDALPDYDRTQRPDPLAAYLRAAHEAHEAVARLAAVLAAGVADEARATAAVLRKARAPEADIDAIAAIAAAAPRAEPSAAPSSATPAEPSTAPSAASPIDPIDACARAADALRALGDTVGRHVTEAEAKQLLGQGRYADAMRKQVELTTGLDSTVQISSGKRGLDAPPTPVAEPAAPPAVPAGGVVVTMPPRAVDPVTLAYRRLEKVRFLRGLLSALAMAVATWAVYRGAWWGTEGDLAGIAVLAFFTDFTVDSVLQAVTALRRPAGA